MLENTRVKQQKHHKDESCRRDAFEVAQEERFRLVHKYMNAQDTNFNNFAMYAMDQFNQICQDMGFNNGVTQTGINNIIRYQYENHCDYQ